MARPRRHIALIAALVLLCGLGGAAYLWLWRPWNPVGTWLAISALATPSGDTVLLAQSRNAVWTEPYTISVFLKQDGRVFSFYVDHEDFYWHHAGLIWRPDREDAALMRGNSIVGTLDPSRRVLRLSDGRSFDGVECAQLPAE